jgi:hypothetical protein
MSAQELSQYVIVIVINITDRLLHVQLKYFQNGDTSGNTGNRHHF